MNAVFSAVSQPVPLVDGPTPVRLLEEFSTDETELWMKDDGLTSKLYGGNKVRKLEWLMAEALKRNARRVVTVGAVGSHQVLATTVFAKRLGLPVSAVVVPQRRSDHAELVLRQTVASGADLHASSSFAAAPAALARLVRRGDFVIPPGGSNVLGTLGYVGAMRELVSQIQARQLPPPDLMVAPLGSGGTVAGLLAGVLREGLQSRVIGVDVATVGSLARSAVLTLATLATRRDGGSAGPYRLARQLTVDDGFLGEGYAIPTAAGHRAQLFARKVGLQLDPTYSAKAFAAALTWTHRSPGPRRKGRRRVVLFWNTLSAHAPQSLPEPLPPLSRLPYSLRRLLQAS